MHSFRVAVAVLSCELMMPAYGVRIIFRRTIYLVLRSCNDRLQLSTYTNSRFVNKKYGSITVIKKFLDKDGNVKENAPKGLKEEQEALKKAKEAQ